KVNKNITKTHKHNYIQYQLYICYPLHYNLIFNKIILLFVSFYLFTLYIIWIYPGAIDRLLKLS
ncbi:hypothetical protein BC941DRAFT_409953, partial [Chlamydoabsidia padenii]